MIIERIASKKEQGVVYYYLKELRYMEKRFENDDFNLKLDEYWGIYPKKWNELKNNLLTEGGNYDN